MFHFRRPLAALRVRALRRLYQTHFLENTAEARGLRLLRGWLSPRQRAQLDSEGAFDVIGSDSGRRYRICYGTSTNIREIDRMGRPGNSWCFVPVGGLVAGDVMLAQKIALETGETAALSVANKVPLLFCTR